MSESETKPGSVFEKSALDGSAFSHGLARFLNCETDGFINFTAADGVSVVDYPVHKGYNPIKADYVNVPTTGSAPTSVWGGFE